MDQVLQQSLSVTTRLANLLLNLAERFVTWTLTSGLRIVIVLLLAWVAIRVIRGLLGRLKTVMVGTSTSIERIKRADTVTGMLQTVGVIFVIAAALMMTLRETGIDIAPVLATAGIGGLAIGFGAQTLVKDVISGFFLLVEEQMRIGDIVEVGGKGGVVEGVTLRTIRLRDVSGNVHIIPNGSVSVVTNMTRDYSRYVFDVQVARKEDPDRVCEALRGIGQELQQDPAYGDDILQPLEVFGVESIAAASMTVK
ncbi:MAG: mechanosensitive ion channel family protein, partial [Candidatus Binatia bacterium]